jgi:hypothetical protein
MNNISNPNSQEGSLNKPPEEGNEKGTYLKSLNDKLLIAHSSDFSIGTGKNEEATRNLKQNDFNSKLAANFKFLDNSINPKDSSGSSRVSNKFYLIKNQYSNVFHTFDNIMLILYSKYNIIF